MITDKRRAINRDIDAQSAFNRKSDRLIAQLRAGEITVNEYDQRLEEARETLEEAREAARA